jgi:hypothetical protein
MSTKNKFQGTDTRFDWENAIDKVYSEDVVKGATGKIGIGRNDGAQYFVFRYIRIEPGGHSALNDHHPHDHGVMILHRLALVITPCANNPPRGN